MKLLFHFVNITAKMKGRKFKFLLLYNVNHDLRLQRAIQAEYVLHLDGFCGNISLEDTFIRFVIASRVGFTGSTITADILSILEEYIAEIPLLLLLYNVLDEE